MQYTKNAAAAETTNILNVYKPFEGLERVRFGLFKLGGVFISNKNENILKLPSQAVYKSSYVTRPESIFGLLPCDDFSIVEDYNGVLLESAQIDLEFSHQLLPSPTRSDIIAKHLSAIRTQFPKMKDINHDSKWMVGRLVTTNCKKTIDECAELINATEYGPMEASLLDESCDSFLFLFEKPYNPEILGPMIGGLCECSTEPSYFGVDGTIEINVFSENEAKYTFSRTLEKSPTGHTYKHFWKYSVVGHGLNFVVHLENEWEKDSSLN